eukprot:gene6145-6767_t
MTNMEDQLPLPSSSSSVESSSPWSERDYTLVFCRRFKQDNPQEKEILLGMKKRGFGQGKWNGYGGKLEDKESLEACARRELEEECGLVAEALRRVGFLSFKMEESRKIMAVHVYECWHFHEGEAVETEEMRPQWYNEKEIPFDAMWPDDRFWLPLLLAGKSFLGRFVYEDDETISEHSIKEQ